MKSKWKKMKKTVLTLLFVLACAGLFTAGAGRRAEAATTGFKTVNGITYYYDSNGKKHTGWLTLNGRKYFFLRSGAMRKGWTKINGKTYYFGVGKLSIPTNCYMATGWRTDGKGNRRYFGTNGALVTGWKKIKGYNYYFKSGTGIMVKGWLKIKNTRFYLHPTNGAMVKNKLIRDSKTGYYRYVGMDGKMVRGWKQFNNNVVRFFINQPGNDSVDGKMAVGFVVIDGKKYYFRSSNGSRLTGWLTNSRSGNKYYLDPADGGAAVVNTTKVIDGIEYKFSVSGIATPISDPEEEEEGKPVQTDGKKTIKNYLAQALQPVGQALYVWGGGWNDSNRKGVSPAWKKWYDSQGRDYDYNDYRDLSDENRAKGLDCSGFVGWAAYQVMHQTSNESSGYTVVSGDVGGYYASLGWGSIITQAKLAATSWRVYAGDIGYNDGHVWIILGQCSDKSAVIVHSTPQAGCQIAGTPTPDTGNYDSEAIALARKYMSRYAGYTKFEYHPSSGNYIRNGNYLRWNRSTLADPDGYMNKTADQILFDLFGY